MQAYGAYGSTQQGHLAGFATRDRGPLPVMSGYRLAKMRTYEGGRAAVNWIGGFHR